MATNANTLKGVDDVSTVTGGISTDNVGNLFLDVVVLGNYANDGAAATGGVPVGGLYRNGSVLMVRVA